MLEIKGKYNTAKVFTDSLDDYSREQIENLVQLDNIRCPVINASRARKSIGTLGGGNHFIEVNRDDENNLYIVIHKPKSDDVRNSLWP